MTPSRVPIPPPPPPPVTPAPPLVFKCSENVTGSNKPPEAGHTETRQVSEKEFVQEVIELGGRLSQNGEGGDREHEEDQVILVVAIPLQTVILQNGPMCGIVALAEALEILNARKEKDGRKNVSPKVLLDRAIQEGFTKQGEMFSAKAMQSLAEQHGAFPDQSKILNVGKEPGCEILFREMVFHNLRGYPLLFPYDADHNHTPAMRKGHAAHWAVIHGVVCSVPYRDLSSILDPDDHFTSSSSSPFKVLHSSRHLIILKPLVVESTTSDDHGAQCEFENFIAKHISLSNCHIICHQGKSFRTALWKYADLLESNRNLKEVSPKILANQQEFILFEGIEEGLCSKILLLK